MSVYRDFPRQYSDPGETMDVQRFTKFVDEEIWAIGRWGSCSMTLHPYARDLIYILYRRYELGRKGRHKMTFIDDHGDVIKVPLSYDGLRAARKEVEMFNRPNSPIPMAKCILEKVGPWWVEYMELVSHEVDGKSVGEAIENISDSHSWVWDIDCDQVGLNREGSLVAFDL